MTYDYSLYNFGKQATAWASPHEYLIGYGLLLTWVKAKRYTAERLNSCFLLEKKKNEIQVCPVRWIGPNTGTADL